VEAKEALVCTEWACERDSWGVLLNNLEVSGGK
jgi:hypothetical protein